MHPWIWLLLIHTPTQQFYGPLSGTTQLSRYRKKLTPVLIINHPFSTASIYYGPQHPPCSIYMLDSLIAQHVSKFSLFYLVVWHPPLHTPYISFFIQSLSSFCNTCPCCHNLFCCSTEIMSSNPSLSTHYLELFYLNAAHPSDYPFLCSLKSHLIFFSYRPGFTSIEHTTLHTAAIHSPSHN